MVKIINFIFVIKLAMYHAKTPCRDYINQLLGDSCWDALPPRKTACRSYEKETNTCTSRKINKWHELATPSPYPTNRNCFYNMRCQKGFIHYVIEEYDFAEDTRVLFNGEQKSLAGISANIGHYYNHHTNSLSIQYTSTSNNYGFGGLRISWKCVN